MWILYDNGDEEIVEVKYKIDLAKPRVIEQIGIQKEWCKANKIRHKILTDFQIRESAILLSNYESWKEVDPDYIANDLVDAASWISNDFIK